MQTDAGPMTAATSLVPYDGEVYLWPHFVAGDEAQAMQQQLLTELAWHGEEITIRGRRVAVPRLVCWYGDPQAIYRYSGVTHEPRPWHPLLAALRQRLQATTGYPFNSVLANLYRDGADSMGWHADKEPELGGNPAIASLSFGATRLFKLRHNRTGTTLDITLGHGALLLMAGSLQHHWRHCLPKSTRVQASRINLTYRYIAATSQ
jgi:alkylated DNA repair dioxygenase AlkB